MNLSDFSSTLAGLHTANLPKVSRSLTYSLKEWMDLRDKTDLPYAKWSDSELSNHDKQTGYIGQKVGIHCYCYVSLI